MKKTPLQYALDLVSMRDRTEAELRRKMLDKKIETPEIEKAINFLKEKNFLDDSRFVKNFIASSKRQGRFGRRRIFQKLKIFGISNELLEEAWQGLDEDSEEERAIETASKWLSKKGSNDNFKEKLIRHLIGRGFDYDIIKKAMGELNIY